MNLIYSLVLFLILLFYITNIKFPSNNETERFYQSNNLKLAIHTVFLPNENIFFLEEWLKYHIHIGFTKFYLYDNDKGNQKEEKTCNKKCKDKINKYNIDFDSLFDSEYRNKIYKQILDKYKKYIVYIKWQPRNKKNKIYYGQQRSIKEYIKKYKHENDWTAFIDIDEFIILKDKSYNSLKDFISSYDSKGFNKIVINQRKMIDRYCDLNSSIFDLNDSIIINTEGWANKSLCKNLDLSDENLEGNFNIHSIKVNNKKELKCNENQLYFNHYNINKNQIDWMKYNFKKDLFKSGKNEDLSKFKSKLFDESVLKYRIFKKEHANKIKDKCHVF